jgi:hypothetical protein
MNFVNHPANSPAKLAGLPASGNRQSGILPFILPNWQEAEGALGRNSATRQFSRQSVGIPEGWNRVSRQTSRQNGGIAVIGGSAFHHPAMMPLGISTRTFTRTFCPVRVNRNPDTL